MTPEQISMARALARVTFPPGLPGKRFALDMAEQANLRPMATLTAKQAEFLAEMVVRYRRQIQSEVVALAQSALGSGGST